MNNCYITEEEYKQKRNELALLLELGKISQEQEAEQKRELWKKLDKETKTRIRKELKTKFYEEENEKTQKMIEEKQREIMEERQRRQEKINDMNNDMKRLANAMSGSFNGNYFGLSLNK